MYTVCVLYVYIKSWVSNYHPSWIWLEMNDLPHIIIYRDSHNSLVFFFCG